MKPGPIGYNAYMELLWWIFGELVFGAVGFILQVICWGPFLIASKIASLFREPK